jgi:hypothetical protein
MYVMYNRLRQPNGPFKLPEAVKLAYRAKVLWQEEIIDEKTYKHAEELSQTAAKIGADGQIEVNEVQLDMVSGYSLLCTCMCVCVCVCIHGEIDLKSEVIRKCLCDKKTLNVMNVVLI